MTVVVISVDEFPLKPVSYRNLYFCRRNNSNHLLSVDEITEMRFVSLNYSFDSFEVNTTFEALDDKALQNFSKRIIETGRYNSSGNLRQNLEKLGFLSNGKVTRAAQLLFGAHHTGIHIGRFKTPETIIDDIVIRSPLVLAVEGAMNFIKRNITLGYEFIGELKRVERWQFPLQAIRELLLNAVVHKDYTNPTDVIVKIFDNSIEISNPGKLIGGLTVEDLQTDHYQPRHRNKLLAEAFYLTGDIEKYGTGFVRIRRWLSDYPKLGYKFSDLGDFIKITIAETVKDSTHFDKVTDKVTDNQALIIKLIIQNPKITTHELSKAVGISQRKIKENIAKLKTANLLKRIGHAKTGHWEIIG